MFAISLAVIVHGAPAHRDSYVVVQPDGTQFRATTTGDEYVNLTVAEDGYPVKQNPATGAWEYAETDMAGALRPSGRVVGRDVPDNIRMVTLRDLKRAAGRSAGRTMVMRDSGVPSRAAFNNVGVQRVLVILTGFSDTPITSTEAEWNDRIFGTTGSTLYNYYMENSFNQLGLLPVNESSGTANNGIVSVTLPRVHPNTADNTGEANRIITRDAINAADAYVNFATYDTDGNGYISRNEMHVIVVVAGYERALNGGGPPSVWAHQWCLFASDPPPSPDGKTVTSCGHDGGYMQVGELHSYEPNPAIIATVGIIAHEMGHDLGLPDLYDTDLSSNGVGGWSLMASGSWGAVLAGGDRPVHLDAWCKSIEGWVPGAGVQQITATAVNKNMQIYNEIFRLLDNPNGPEMEGTGEYFLIEGRKRGMYFEQALPGEGMLIWHIDETRADNDNENRKLVDLEEAAGVQNLDTGMSSGDADDMFYPGNNTVFGSVSTPDSNLYSGAASMVGVSGISAIFTSGGEFISATYTVILPDTTPPDVPQLLSPDNAALTNDNTPALDWTDVADPSGVYYVLLADTDPSFASPDIDETIVTSGYVPATALPDGTYYWKVKAVDEAGNSSAYTAARTVVIDATAPLFTITDGVNASYNASDTITVTVSDGAGSGAGAITYFAYSLDSACGAADNFANTGLSVTVATTYSGYICFRNTDVAGNTGYSAAIGKLKVDTDPPAMPDLLTPGDGVATSDNTPFFDWSAVIDSSGVTYYLLIDDSPDFSSPVAELTPTPSSYTPASPLGDGTYYWKVKAVDRAGNPGGYSATRTVTIDSTAPVFAISDGADASWNTSDTVTVSVSDGTGTGIGTTYYAFSDDSTCDSYDSYTSTGLTVTVASDYSGYICFTNMDAVGNTGYSEAIGPLHVDVTLPAMPAPVSPGDGVVTFSNTPTFDWADVTDTSGVTYTIAIDDQQDFESLIVDQTVSASSYIQTEPLADGVYYWIVKTTDGAGNSSEWSSIRSLTVQYQAGPTPPGPVVSFTATPYDSHARLIWSNPADSDFSGVVILRSTTGFAATHTEGVVVFDGDGESTYDMDLINYTTYHYTAFAYDTEGTYSAIAATATATPVDLTPPASVSSFEAMSLDSSVALSWVNPADPDFSHVIIQRSTTDYIGSSTEVTNVYTGSQTSYTDTELVNNTIYYYSIFTCDTRGNCSTLPETTIAMPVDTTPPDVVSSFTITPAESSFSMQWINPSADDFSGVVIQRSITDFPATHYAGNNVYTGMSESFVDTGISAGTTYYYSIFSYDSSGNYSLPATGTASLTDTIAPDPVTAFAAEGSSHEIDFSWVNPIDSDYKETRIAMATDTWPSAPTQENTIYSGNGDSVVLDDTWIENNVTYYFTAFAVDNSGNVSTGATATAVPFSMTLELQSGWNLVGVPLNDATISLISTSAEDRFEIFLLPDYTPLSKTTAISLNLSGAYMVYSERRIAGQITGAPTGLSTTQYGFATGWNVFSLPFSSSVIYNTSHFTLRCGGVSTPLPDIYSYEDGLYQKIVSGGVLIPWRAYWAKSSSACILSVTK